MDEAKKLAKKSGDDAWEAVKKDLAKGARGTADDLDPSGSSNSMLLLGAAAVAAVVIFKKK